MITQHGLAARHAFKIYDYENDVEYLQVYNRIIVRIDNNTVTLDEKYWKHSKTTSKYRNAFLGEKSNVIEKKVKMKEYMLDNLNRRR